MPRRFAEVDVFASDPLTGNPVAVVLDAEGLDDASMQAFARWTNLSETTFVLPPQVDGADYRLRIFTPGGELPFAGHPTLGSAWAWLQESGSTAERLVQECGVGLVPLKRREDGLAFAAPPLLRSGAPDDADLAAAARALCLPAAAVVDAAWVDNGPGWLALRLPDAKAVLAVEPDVAHMTMPIGIIGPYAGGSGSGSGGDGTGAEGPNTDGPGTDFEVRAFVPSLGIAEDPVTGSLNAGIASWFFESGVVDSGYTVRQGTAVGAAGRVVIDRDDEGIWVGGRCETRITGTVDL